MVKIGWLADNPGFIGGTEVSSSILLSHIPEDFEVVYCPPNKRPPKVDIYVVQNCTQYDQRWIEELILKPVVKSVRDPYFGGDAVLRNWFLKCADLLIFNSPLQFEEFHYQVRAKHVFIPPPVEVDKFKACALPKEQRHGNLFVGRVGPTKGAHLAIDWALCNNQPLDLVGYVEMNYGRLPKSINFLGNVDYEHMPEIMGKYERLVFFPQWIESFGRVVAEAWAAGCDLLTNENIGALWWIEHNPGAIQNGAALYWEAVRGVLHDQERT
jgi:glycosyltransferase involved in cell wall biosynthesis